MTDTATLARFWAKVDKRGPDECWLWTGAKNNGYGKFKLRSYTLVTATRFVMEQALGAPVPSTLDVCHRCDNPPCCNPAHLFLGTRLDNMADCVSKGRTGYNVRTYKEADTHRSKLTLSDVNEIRSAHLLGVRGVRLAELYGVTKKAINAVLHGECWVSRAWT